MLGSGDSARLTAAQHQVDFLLGGRESLLGGRRDFEANKITQEVLFGS